MVNFGKPQKALHLHLEEDKKKSKHQGHEYCVMEKFDGWYMYVDLIDGEWQGIRSKTGRTLPSMAKYDKLLEELPVPAANCRFIFEAVIPQEDGPRGYMEFKDCNGLFNQKKRALDNVVIKMHDVLIEGRSNAVFGQRYNTLSHMFQHWAKTDHVGSWLQQVPILLHSSDKVDWILLYNEIVADGGDA